MNIPISSRRYSRLWTHFRERGLRPAIIEKDYYVTEALRIISATTGDKVIFKGGASLSKGWNLLRRFSEDIDIFLDSLAYKPALGKNAIDRELKRLRDSVGAHPALTFVVAESQTISGFGRNDRFSYEQRFGGPGEVASRVLLEAGTANGREPTTVVERHSSGNFCGNEVYQWAARMREHFPCCFTSGAPRREDARYPRKGRAAQAQRAGARFLRSPLLRSVQLAAQPEVVAMLKSAEYETIKKDYDRISRAHFERSYFYPNDMRFANSDALFPPADLAATLDAEYSAQCRLLR
jgi:hypothetical protein